MVTVLKMYLQLVFFFVIYLQERGKKIKESMRSLEKQKMAQMEELLSHGVEEPDFLVNLFSSSVKEEVAVYSKS